MRKGICDPDPTLGSVLTTQARKWGYRCRGRAVKQGTCGIFALPSFRHDCRRERSGHPTTPYAVVATGALLFGASPTLTDSGVTSPMVDCWAGTMGVSSFSATTGASTLSVGSADSCTVAGVTVSFFSLGSFLPPALETVRAREPKMLLLFSFLGTAGVSSFFSTTGSAAEVSATGTTGSTPLATTGADVSSTLGVCSVEPRVGAVSTAGDLAFSLLPKNLPKEKCSFSLTGVTGLAASVLGASSLASARGASVVSVAGATTGVSSTGFWSSGRAVVSLEAVAGMRSASFFSWEGLLTFSKKDPKMEPRLVGLGFSSVFSSFSMGAGATIGASAVSVSMGAGAAVSAAMGAGVGSVFSSSPVLGMSEVMTGAVVEVSPIWGATDSSFLTSGSATCSSALSFLPRRPPKMLARLRDWERLLLLAAFFLFFFSASEDELLEEDPARTGPAASATGVSVSAGLVASTLFFGAAAAVVAAASVVGLPTRHVSMLQWV